MNLLNKLNDNLLIKIMKESKNRVYLSLPSIYQYMAAKIINEVEAGDLRIIVDFSEEKIRDGFGDIESIEMLRNSRIVLKSLPNNMVSFIICDDIGYFLFPKSKYSQEPENNFNAVRMNNESILAVIDYFFKPEFEISSDKDLDKPAEPNQKFQAKEIPETIFKQVKRNIVNNPPINPDFNKILNVYKTKLEFVELQFEGANITSQKVNIPSKLLPFKDETIKKSLETRFVLFNNIEERKEYEKFAEIKETIKNIRNTYLLPFSERKKSFIDKNRKSEFENEVKKCQDKLFEAVNSLTKLLTSEILDSKKRFTEELQDFLLLYPIHEQHDYTNNYDYHYRFNKDKATEIVYSIKFPDIEKLLGEIEIKLFFYEISENDLKDDKFLNSLIKHGIITEEDKSSLAEEFKAVELKK